MKMMLTLVVLVCTCGCGGLNLPEFDSLISHQPMVVAVEPTDGATIKADSGVAVEFSEQIDPASVDARTLAVVKASADGSKARADVVDSIVKGKEKGIEGVYSFEGAGRACVFKPREPYEAGATYMLVATAGIVSVEAVPLSQKPGRTTTPFVSTFHVEGAASADGSDAAPGGNGATGGEASGGGGASGGSGASGGAGMDAPVRNRPGSLVINELLYDIPGDDTDGHLFVELAGDAGGKIGGYKILFINGDDGTTTGTIEFPEGAVVADDGIFLIADSKTGRSGESNVADADFIDNFDPQNGPDCVQLLNDKGELVDALGYGTPIKSPAANGLACFEGTPAAKAAAGSSLSRTGGADTGNNAADFRAQASPTPGVL